MRVVIIWGWGIVVTITSKHEFLTAATHQFNIFAGSYISTMGAIAPNVPTARAAILSALKDELDASNWLATRYVADYVTAALSRAPIEERTYLIPSDIATSMERIKFEELMRRLSDLSGDPNFLDRIIQAMYSVQPGSFNTNHSAIAFLLSAGHCHTVYTTNFDNAIENACLHLGFAPRVMTPDQLPLPPTDQMRGVIVKLHGCAQLGHVVANSTAFRRLQELNSFASITHRVEALPCLFFGYSGTGDVDIAPHLRKVRDPSQLIWTNYKAVDNPFAGSRTAVLDLNSADPDANFLLALASAFGWQPEATRSNAPFDPALRRVLSSTGGTAYAADALLDLAGLYNPQVHALYWFINGRSNFIRDDHVFAKDPRMLSLPLNRECLVELNQYSAIPLYQQTWRAFVTWRMGRPGAALADLNSVLGSATPTTNVGRHALLRASEIGLGVIAEQLWLSGGSARLVNVNPLQAEFLQRADTFLAQPWWSDLETIDRRLKREKRRAEIAFRTSGDKPRATDELRRLFELSRDLQLCGEMIGLVHSAWLVDAALGDEFDQVRRLSPIATGELSAVIKKDFVHRNYNGWMGRAGLFLGERIVPPAAELPFAAVHYYKGRRARAEFTRWRKRSGL